MQTQTESGRPATRPFFSYGPLFRELTPPTLADLTGDFEATLLGPPWFRSVAQVSLGFGGLPDWYGKRFDSKGQGINLLKPGNELKTAIPMQVRIEPSRLDGRPAAVVHYGADSPFPWRFVLDELRFMEGDTMLGMTLLDLAVLRGFALPFLLHRL